MPSFSNDVPYQTTVSPPSSHPRSVDPSHGKPHEKAPVGNTFLWTNWPNGDASHRDSSSNNDRQYVADLRNGSSAYSLNNGPRSSMSSHNRDLPHSKDGSMHSLGNGSARDYRDTTPRVSATLDRDLNRKSFETGAGMGATGSSAASISSQQQQQYTGASPSSRSLNGKVAAVNGDYHSRPSLDQLASSDLPGNASVPALSTSQPEDSHRLSSSTTTGPHRYSSPPVPSGIDGIVPSSQLVPQQQQSQDQARQRHTLQVPRSGSSRRNSRDQSEDAMAYASGRTSPPSGIRRTSMSLARRTTRTNHSDSIVDDLNPDEDASRYAEVIKQRRASKRRRRDDDDDERVIVGTKVDQHHVNWVTAYNMLTGIRFTVSRINAKMERELTPADFEAKHKFSFDMYYPYYYLFSFLGHILTMPLVPETS